LTCQPPRAKKSAPGAQSTRQSTRAREHQLDSLPGRMLGSAGVPTRPAGYTGDELTGRLWNTTNCLTAAPLTHTHSLTHSLTRERGWLPPTPACTAAASAPPPRSSWARAPPRRRPSQRACLSPRCEAMRVMVAHPTAGRRGSPRAAARARRRLCTASARRRASIPIRAVGKLFVGPAGALPKPDLLPAKAVFYCRPRPAAQLLPTSPDSNSCSLTLTWVLQGGRAHLRGLHELTRHEQQLLSRQCSPFSQRAHGCVLIRPPQHVALPRCSCGVPATTPPDQ
jgi:hypothetical protein